MNKYTLAIALLLSSQISSAWDFTDFKAKPFTALFGVASGIAIHEGGHMLVATSMGKRFKFDNTTIVYPGETFTDSQSIQVSSAGYQAQWIASEVALRYAEYKKEPIGNFSAGVVLGHLSITAAYLTFLHDHEDGDLTAIKNRSDRSRAELATYLAVPALLDAWRLFRPKDIPKWVPNVSLASKATMMTFIWAY